MGDEDRARTGLPQCALVIGLLAAGLLFAPASSVGAGSTLSDRGLPAGSRAGPLARNLRETSLVDQGRLPGTTTIVSQVHNGFGWQPSHTYAYATAPYTRVVNGDGWNPAGHSYHPGQTLDAYQLISSGTCTSGSSGGPRGIGSMIKDGTCSWKYLSAVDYISITGWAFDNRPWKSGILYHYRDYVTSDSPLRAYALEDDSCLSTVAPTATGSGAKSTVVTSDGCHWQYEADILYSSERSYIPTEAFTRRDGPATIMLRSNYEAQLWNDREYVGGQNGEASPIRTQDHDDYKQEGGVLLGCTDSPCYHLIITTAPGESFRDNLTPADPLIGYDPGKGVAIRNDLPYRWPYEPAGVDVHDNYVDIIGLQIKSVHGAAVNGKSSFGNAMIIRDCILDGGSDDRWTSQAAVTTDTSSVVANSLIISHAPIGIDFKYPGYALHDTIVNPDHVANSVGITTWHNWIFKGQIVSNSAIFGFAHAAASTAEVTSSGPDVAWLGGQNVTDAPQGNSGRNTPGGIVYTLPGTAYGASDSAAFGAPHADWRTKSGGPLAGGGSAFGNFGLYCPTGGYSAQPNCPRRVNYDFDSPDIIGTARPQAGRYDIGAWQSCASATLGRHLRCISNVGTAGSDESPVFHDTGQDVDPRRH